MFDSAHQFAQNHPATTFYCVFYVIPAVIMTLWTSYTLRLLKHQPCPWWDLPVLAEWHPARSDCPNSGPTVGFAVGWYLTGMVPIVNLMALVDGLFGLFASGDLLFRFWQGTRLAKIMNRPLLVSVR